MHLKIKIKFFTRKFHRTSINQDYACQSIFPTPSSSRTDILRVPIAPATFHYVTCNMNSYPCTMLKNTKLNFSAIPFSFSMFFVPRVQSCFCFVSLFACFLFFVLWEKIMLNSYNKPLSPQNMSSSQRKIPFWL